MYISYQRLRLPFTGLIDVQKLRETFRVYVVVFGKDPPRISIFNILLPQYLALFIANIS